MFDEGVQLGERKLTWGETQVVANKVRLDGQLDKAPASCIRGHASKEQCEAVEGSRYYGIQKCDLCLRGGKL